MAVAQSGSCADPLTMMQMTRKQESHREFTNYSEPHSLLRRPPSSPSQEEMMIVPSSKTRTIFDNSTQHCDDDDDYDYDDDGKKKKKKTSDDEYCITCFCCTPSSKPITVSSQLASMFQLERVFLFWVLGFGGVFFLEYVHTHTHTYTHTPILVDWCTKTLLNNLLKSHVALSRLIQIDPTTINWFEAFQHFREPLLATVSGQLLDHNALPMLEANPVFCSSDWFGGFIALWVWILEPQLRVSTQLLDHDALPML